MVESNNNKYIKPIMRYTGSKYNCLSQILPHLPRGNRLIEVFAGTAIVSANTCYKEYWINDINKDLINILYYIITDIHNTYDILTNHYLLSITNINKDIFNTVRDYYNNQAIGIYRAIALLWLNYYSYGGVIRYNKQGNYTGTCGSPRRCSLKDRLSVYTSNILSANNVNTTTLSYIDWYNNYIPIIGDVIYLDPPYHSQYNKMYNNNNNNIDHILLRDIAEDIHSKGIPVVISNNDSGYTRDLYSNATDIITINIRYNKISNRTTDILAIYR